MGDSIDRNNEIRNRMMKIERKQSTEWLRVPGENTVKKKEEKT